MSIVCFGGGNQLLGVLNSRRPNCLFGCCIVLVVQCVKLLSYVLSTMMTYWMYVVFFPVAPFHTILLYPEMDGAHRHASCACTERSNASSTPRGRG